MAGDHSDKANQGSIMSILERIGTSAAVEGAVVIALLSYAIYKLVSTYLMWRATPPRRPQP